MNATDPHNELVSIAEAATQTSVHRRTIERWINNGQLTALRSESDRRKRLVDVNEVKALAHASPLPERTVVKPIPTQSDNKSGLEFEARDFQEVMDNALQLVYSHLHRMVTQLFPEAFRSLSLDQLRSGPFGQDLLRLARLARGQIREPKELVLESIDSVLQLLFWPAAAEDYSVPRAFWDTDLGRMLALAKYRAYQPEELVSIISAAEQLGVSRPTIYQWMDDRLLSYVRDEQTGRTFIVRRDIENLKRLAVTFRRER
jgi:excisionase family DNA binding protein